MRIVEMTVLNDRQNKGDLKPGSHIHLVGIGGFGLSAIARVLLGRGFVVSGSDLQRNDLTAELDEAGATIYYGHDAGHIRGADALLVSSAIPISNPEYASALEAGLPVLKRADLIGDLMGDSYGIAVAGTHGKTTTTGMIAQILVAAEFDPSVIVGGVLPLFGTNGRAGQGEYFVVEADEYDYMFLGLRPMMSVITNIEYDHPDIFLAEDDYLSAFREFVELLPEAGTLIICVDDLASRELAFDAQNRFRNMETYGIGEALWRAVDLRPNQLGGLDCLDIDFNIIRKALAEFSGIGRRFEVVGEAGDVIVVDDYAHHPTEIRATLAAARQRYVDRRIWAVWQPHTYSRVKSLLSEFAKSFDDADVVVVLDIYKSREKDTLGIDENTIVESIAHPNSTHTGGIDETVTHILDRVRPGDVIITLTAGDGNLVGKAVLEVLQMRAANHTSTNGQAGDRNDQR